jgi:hypothetical protein
MQSPTASDPSFKAFLEKLQEQNNRGFATQLVQLKAEREIAGEDGDKREEQLDDVISSLKEVRDAVSGSKLDIDLTPLVSIGENQTKLLEELSKEASLTRKLTEGSVEYDKEAAQYRNTSGRDIESTVSGKTSKDGGFLDFETARDTLSGQGKRVREDNAFSLKPISYTPGKTTAAAVSGGKGSSAASKEVDIENNKFQGFFKELESGFKFFMTDSLSEKPGYGIFQKPPEEVVKKERETKVSSPRQENPEADNVTSTGEIQADAAKSDLELSKQMLDTTRESLTELKAIREALAPSTPKDLVEQKSAPSATNEKEEGGSLLGDLAGAAGNLLGGRGKVGKPAGKAASLGSKVVGGLGKAARVLGPAAAIAGAAYSGFEGYQNTGSNFDLKDDEQATLGQKTASTLGGVASGLTFGLIDEKSAAQGIHKAGEAVSETASKAGSFISEKASSIGSSISNFFSGDSKNKNSTSTNIATNNNPVTSSTTTNSSSISANTSTTVQGMGAQEAATARSNYAAVDPRRVDSAGKDVSQTSTENRDMEREANTKSGGNGSTIVSNNVSSNNTTKIVPMKANPRPEYTGSSLDRYTNRITVY